MKLDEAHKKQIEELLKEGRLCDLLLYASYCNDKKGSLESIRHAFDYLSGNFKLSDGQINELREIAGAAHLMMLDLEKAEHYFNASANQKKINELFDVALWYGKYPRIVKRLGASDGVYKKFLLEKALPHLPLGRDKDGFYTDDNALDFVLNELRKEGLEPKSALEDAVLKMEEKNNRNIAKRFLLAQYSGNKELIERNKALFAEKLGNKRKNIDGIVKEYAALNNFKYLGRIQEGDKDDFFPIASSLFMAERGGKKEVLKEHLRLYVDFSRLDGYNQEKEIYELIKHKNIIGYLGSFCIDGNEFLRFEFFEGKNLSEYTIRDNLLPAGEAVKIIKDIAEAIDYLHDKGIIYMDIKDKNLLYDGKEIRLLDFGMARIAEEKACSLLSTPEYVPPEMAATFTAYKNTDIFQLGILAHKLLTGKHPFAKCELYDFIEGDEFRESEIVKYALANTFNKYGPCSDEPCSGLDGLLARMLDKEPLKRPSAKEVVECLNYLEAAL